MTPEDNGILKKVKKWTAYGAAFITLLAVFSGLWMVVTKGYAFAQKVEVYVSLPAWLERVEGKIDATLEKVDNLEKKTLKKVDTLEIRVHELEHNEIPR